MTILRKGKFRQSFRIVIPPLRGMPDARNALEFSICRKRQTLAETHGTSELSCSRPIITRTASRGDEAAMKMAEEQTKKVNYNF